MKNLRRHGKAPFNIAVVHGGPGAAGEMAPVARKLKAKRGILEPFQTALSISGQVEELKTLLEENGGPPLILIGFSWGAWLSFIFAAHYPGSVRKLILVGSGPFEEKYAAGIQNRRLERLSHEDRKEAESLIKISSGSATKHQARVFKRLGELYSRVDAYDPVASASEAIDFRADIFQNVWKEAEKLRSSGRLLQVAKKIKCPVVAIHGEYDPHLAEGVQKPLSAVLTDFRFVLLKKCGHKPWIERQAREEFFQLLKEELL